MFTLEQIATQLARECPRLEVRVSEGGLEIRRGRNSVRILQPGIGELGPRERRIMRSEGRSYVDLGTGSVYVDEPGLLLYARVSTIPATGLTAYQCALLSGILERGGAEWFVAGRGASQVRLIRRMRLELGVEVPANGMSRFLRALRETGIAAADGDGKLAVETALQRIRKDFRLGAVGQAERYAGEAELVTREVRDQLGAGIAGGVTEVIHELGGAWLEPRDFLVDPGAMPAVSGLLGAPVPRDYDGPTVILRPTKRVPLGLLTLGTGALQPLLALAEAIRDPSPVARQAGLEAWREHEARWKSS
jgi:hypothetical protein